MLHSTVLPVGCFPVWFVAVLPPTPASRLRGEVFVAGGGAGGGCDMLAFPHESQLEVVPGVCMTLQTWGHDPFLLGHDPI